MTLTTGTRLGPYEVLGAIGAGGMGEVYRARDTRLGRDVAVKVLPASIAADPDRRARFEREAQAVAALSHPNVVAIFDTGVHEPSPGSGGDQFYVVMELLDGQTLRERLSAGPMPVRKAVEIAAQVARGLGAAHGKGVVHRDLKPDNVFLLDDGQVKILDFGLAKAPASRDAGATADAVHTMQATDAGTVMGTVGYMAPEQVRGQAVDARADLFAFGAVLYEMVSGQRAFQRDTAADTMTAILTQDPPELTGSRPDLPPALDRIIRHCLEKQANERFQNARDIAFALEALSGSAVSSAASGAAAVPADTLPRRPRTGLVLTAAVAGALLVGAAAGYVWRGRPAPASAGVAEITYTPVTFENGFVVTARFTPDRNTIVYSADWDGQPRGVYVTSIESREYRPLGFPGADLLGISRSGDLAILSGSTVTGGNPFWRLGTLARASLTGGAPRAELEGVHFADLGPGGSLAVVRKHPRMQSIEYPVGQVLGETSSSEEDGFAAPRVSPSGDHVAFFDLRVPGACKVRIFDRSGKLVTESRPFSDWWALAWTPANEVWFAAAETSGTQTAIYSLDLEGRQRMVYRAPGAITLHDISPEGDVLVSFDRGKSRIEIIDGDGTAPQARVWREGGGLSAWSASHAMLITATGDIGGPQGSVYVWPQKEAQPVRIGEGAGSALSPDGSKALVSSHRPPITVSIVPTGAGQPQRVDSGPLEQISWAGWLPDGRLVVQGVRPGSGSAVSVFSAAGRDPAPLLPDGVALRGHNLISPDGSRIAAIDAGGGIVVCTVATPACRPVPGTSAGDVVSGWASDNQSLFVHQLQREQPQIDRIDVASGRRSAWKTVRPLNPAVCGVYPLMVSPDGTVAYGYRADASQLYVIKGLK